MQRHRLPASRLPASGLPALGLPALAAAAILSGVLAHASGQSTAFTYQGLLRNGGAPIDGSVDIRFRLYDAPVSGNLLATTPDQTVDVQDGLLTATTDFGPAPFLPGPLYVEIAVRPAGGGAFTTLEPRQPLRPAPRALSAQGAAGAFTFYGASDGQVRMEDFSSQGPRLLLSAENGATVATLEPDVDGSGGFFGVARNDSGAAASDFALWVDGNLGGSQAGFVQINGPERAVTFNTLDAGDASVLLPPSAVSAAEILNEAGAASHNIPFVAIQQAETVIASRTITAPGPGYALVIGGGEFLIQTHDGGGVSVGFAVNNVPELALSDDLSRFIRLPVGLPAGGYSLPVTCSALFPIQAAGEHTFYYVARVFSGPTGIGSFSNHLTVVYLPTAYGAVSPVTDTGVPVTAAARTGGPLPPGLTPAEIEAERRAAAAFDAARVASELDAIRRENEELRRRLDRLEHQGVPRGD